MPIYKGSTKLGMIYRGLAQAAGRKPMMERSMLVSSGVFISNTRILKAME